MTFWQVPRFLYKRPRYERRHSVLFTRDAAMRSESRSLQAGTVGSWEAPSY